MDPKDLIKDKNSCDIIKEIKEHLNYDCLLVIAQYLVRPKKTLLDWIDPYKLDISRICGNPNSIDFIEDLISIDPLFIDQLSWNDLSSNPNAINFIKKFPNKIHWPSLCRNNHPEAVKMILENPDKISWSDLNLNTSKEILSLVKTNNKIDWFNIVKNPSADDFIEEFFNLKSQNLTLLPNSDEYDYVCWMRICSNPLAGKYLKNFFDKINWNNLSENPDPEAIKLLKSNEKLIDWNAFSANINPEAIQMLIENPKKIYWYNFSENPSAISVIAQNKSDICYPSLSKNPEIFQFNKKVFQEELNNMIKNNFKI
jgi:hypothetical protein